MKIVVLDSAILDPGDLDWTPLAAQGKLELHGASSATEVEKRIANADIILSNKAELRKRHIPLLDKCKIIGVLATGYNNVDIEAFARAAIPVCNVPAYGVDDVAQHALALLLELCRQCSAHAQSVHNGEWARRGEWCYWLETPICLSGLTMGIIGFGNIGRRMGEYAHALGMNVLAHSRSRNFRPGYAAFAYAGLEEVLARADVISLHCPLNRDSEKLINIQSLKTMKKGAILLNTARGGLVDEAAIAEALKSGHLRGYGTDVLAKEPPDADNPLFSAPHVLITPHNAWATKKARQKIIEISAENVRAWFEGQPQNVVNAKDLVQK